MRKVFSSHRLENVEAVAELLRAADVDVKISGGRSFQGTARSNFSYGDAQRGKAIPAVWVLQADDYKPARAVLKEAGLLGMATADSLPRNHPAAAERIREPGGASVAARIRIGLIFATMVLALITAQRSCQRTVPAESRPSSMQSVDPDQRTIERTATSALLSSNPDGPELSMPTPTSDALVEPQFASDAPQEPVLEPEDTSERELPREPDAETPPNRRERIIPIELY